MSELAQLETAIGARLIEARLGRHERPVLANRFVVDRVVGRGASGLVVRAYDTKLQRDVAIKCVPSARPEQLYDELVGEARALAALDAVPQVANVHECQIATVEIGALQVPSVLIVMEYIHGESLRRWWLRGRSRAELVTVLVAAARGLEAAHAADIIHRDFKPENVVVASNGLARIVDFGLAYRLALPDAGGTSVRAWRPASGTPAYAAPEIARGEVTSRSDQYSFAVTAWEMLTASLPGASGARAARAHDLPHRLEEALLRSLDPQPRARFGSLEPLRAELERCNESLLQRYRPMLATAAALGATAAAFVLGQRAGRTKRDKE
jgi:serine/threonine protein kinase